jgi:hypothetical protein
MSASAPQKSLREQWDEIDQVEAEVKELVEKGQAKSKILESDRWALAKRLYEEHRAGKTHRQLSIEAGRTRSTITKWIRCHTLGMSLPGRNELG